uniref:Uncharacterized protein n=1 Tax=Siphoviridae sp. ctVDC13 TaxID=2827880 RepID=A0A8S5TC69_9CAUD|nr:MAG TPA: hypothetical protein [Siphoviridae sp. ctVDC13]DAZ66933.1 MAG TPA: hypothetical protein [Caudoviricetes sp.]
MTTANQKVNINQGEENPPLNLISINLLPD